MQNQLSIPQNKFVGFCGECGLSIYTNDFVRFEFKLTEDRNKESRAIYNCIRCRKEVNEDNLIPF